MKTRTLGKNKLKVSAIGLGCMGFSQSYPPYIPFNDAIKVIRGAFDFGVTFFDTADVYGCGENEKLLGTALAPVRKQVVLGTKCGFNLYDDIKDELGRPIGICGKADYVKMAVEKSLQRLKTDYIDIYYLHRVDPNTPIEETAGAMADLIKEGKILNWGISEASASTIRKAHAICPLTAVQSEYSMWYRKPEKEIFPTLEELGISFVPFSPLGKAALTGSITKDTKFAKDDFRNLIPRFNAQNMQTNFKLIEYVENLAKAKQVTPAQIALGWILGQKDWIVPIPGTKKLSRVEENIKGSEVQFSQEELSEINQTLDHIHIIGDRYPEEQEKLTGI